MQAEIGALKDSSKLVLRWMHLVISSRGYSTPPDSSGRRLGLKAGATATETELRNYVRDHLARFKCPQKIHFVPDLPKTATGKVQKYVLRGKPAISKQ
jgi:acyl-CoA synthetase (AMP-forming)/AMP-acid ligase II